MKNLSALFLLMIMTCSFTPLLASDITSTKTEMSQAKVNTISNRVKAIQALDKKTLTKSEKQNLKVELKDMKKSLSDPGAGVYISGTALILIIILLIILL